MDWGNFTGELAKSVAAVVESGNPGKLLLLGLAIISLEALRLVVSPTAGAIGRAIERLVSRLWRS